MHPQQTPRFLLSILLEHTWTRPSWGQSQPWARVCPSLWSSAVSTCLVSDHLRPCRLLWWCRHHYLCCSAPASAGRCWSWSRCSSWRPHHCSPGSLTEVSESESPWVDDEAAPWTSPTPLAWHCPWSSWRWRQLSWGSTISTNQNQMMSNQNQGFMNINQ